MATYDFHGTKYVHGDHGPISYCFRDKRRFPWKVAIFVHPVCITPPLTGLPLEFRNGDVVLKKTRMISYQTR